MKRHGLCQHATAMLSNAKLIRQSSIEKQLKAEMLRSITLDQSEKEELKASKVTLPISTYSRKGITRSSKCNQRINVKVNLKRIKGMNWFKAKVPPLFNQRRDKQDIQQKLINKIDWRNRTRLLIAALIVVQLFESFQGYVMLITSILRFFRQLIIIIYHKIF